MPAESVVQAANVCQLAAPFVSLVAYFPQWMKLVRTKSSESISIRSWCGWVVSSVFALFYAVVQLLLNGNGWALVISALLALIFVVFTLFLTVKYRPGRQTPRG
jgi:uncharacterized protein with PQ loop repeat